MRVFKLDNDARIAVCQGDEIAWRKVKPGISRGHQDKATAD
jgi:hypothetical protein